MNRKASVITFQGVLPPHAAAVATLAVGMLAAGVATAAPVVLVNHDFTNASRTANPQGGTPSSGATGVTGLDAEVTPGGGITNSWNGTTNDYVVATNNNGAMAGSQGGPAFFDAINVTTTDNASPTPGSGIDGNSLRVMNLGAAYSVSTYFPSTTLNNGDSLSASFKVKVTKQNPVAGANAFRVGLFNSNGSQLAANAATLAAGTVFDDDAGYMARYDTGATSFTPNTTNQKRSGGSAANIFAGTLSTLSGPTTDAGGQWLVDTTYDVTFTLLKSPDGSRITLSSTFGDGGAYDDASFSIFDASSPFTTFDHFSIFLSSQFGSATTSSGNFIDDVVVTYTPIPEPAGLAVVSLAAVGLLARRRVPT